MSWNIEKPGDRINGPVTITGNTTLTGTATISGDLTVDTSTLKVDATNNRLGIGTASPAATVSIKQTGAQMDVSTSATDVTFECIDRAATTNAVNTRWYTRNGEFQWNNSSYSRAMTLDSSGRLGIGTAPSESLDVNGAIYVRGANALKLDNASNNYVAQIKNTGASGQSSLEFLLGSPYGTAMTLNNSGNLGLGVTPAAWSGFKALQIARGSLTSFGADTFLSHNWYWSGTADTYIANDYATRYYQSQGKHIWDNGGTSAGTAGATISFATKMTLDASGRLGIGTATVDGKVHIYGDTYANSQLRIQRNGAVNGTFSIGIAGTNNTLYIQDEVNATARLIIDGSGNLGLGSTPSAWSGGRAIDVGTSGAFYGDGLTYDWRVGATMNAYRKVAFNNWYYKATGQPAGRYDVASGGSTGVVHTWQTAASGTADALISWTTAMTLDASGNLGVGETTPLASLHVKGANGAAALFLRGANPSTQTAAAYIKTPVASGYSTTAVYGFWYQNCGITNPDFETIGFNLNGSEMARFASDGKLLLKANGTASAPTIANADNPDTGLYWPTDADTLALAVGGSDAIYIDSSRNVGFGTATPAGFGSGITTLDIKGSSGSGVKLGNATDSSYLYTTSTATYFRTASLKSIIFGTFDTERLTIKSTGQLRFVPLASDPAGAEAGDVYYNSATNKLRCYNGTAWNDLF